MRVISLAIILLILASCAGKNCRNKYDHNYTGHYKVGKPYVIKNVIYYPKEDVNYKEVGVASWYGDRFHCKKTSNNEVFDKKQLSAAHRTLPLPSIVKVTNLANGKAVKVIVNDRGPFANNRIIDLSEKAADKIDMKHRGIAKVKVEYLAQESHNLRKKLKLKIPNKTQTATNKKVIIAKEQQLKPKRPERNIYYVSLGRYKTKVEANAIYTAVEQRYPSKIIHLSLDGKIFYEIELRKKFDNLEEAQQILKRMSAYGFRNTKILKA